MKNVLDISRLILYNNQAFSGCSTSRGIAQLVEQRSPKPRAVSSRLTTPATNAQVLRSLCVLFLRCFCVLELAPLRSANISGKIILVCTSGKSADFPEVPFHGRGRSGEQYFLFTVPVTGEVVPGSSIFICGTCHGWGCRTPSVNCSAKAPSPRELTRRKP